MIHSQYINIWLSLMIILIFTFIFKSLFSDKNWIINWFNEFHAKLITGYIG